MSNKQPWSTPQLKRYGSVEKLTEQTSATITKKTGSGDTITLVIAGNTTTITNSTGGSITNITP